MFSVVGNVFAENKWHQSTIKTIYPLANGDFVLIFNTDSLLCPVDNTGKYHYVRVGQNDVTSEGARNMLSVALAAAAMGKEVDINFDITDERCFINRLFITF
ncbi:hypothetical protein [Saccharophagus degradans]|uniref:Uncharacterized protein n=1 Tax=Saccharophagus degradans (strain 2-40 / ATCC 43961 / DSM 17024) TaxID=203122 RepID=Q21GA9_SACD2|nr:hypothetical protein [Saccharophagus degradans]ABD82270.1 hypothetical protein Sde_3013 [Saccharophagus degradans 2-40]